MFNSDIVTLGELLEIFFSTHNPTTLNKQGADIGTQYRSIILYHDPVQKRVVDKVMKKLNAEVFDGKIVTEVVPFEDFFKAELHHQNYYNQHGGERYCQAVIEPKVLALREKYADKIKKGAM
jgi:peptide-methionine (S)-S-oxide reductase